MTAQEGNTVGSTPLLESSISVQGESGSALAVGRCSAHQLSSSSRVPGSASFIRPNAKGLNTGCAFVTALKDKYLDDGPQTVADPTTTHPSQDNTTASTLYQTNFNREVEVPSLDKIKERFRQLDRLTTVGLEWAAVAFAGNDDELDALCGQLTRKHPPRWRSA